MRMRQLKVDRLTLSTISDKGLLDAPCDQFDGDKPQDRNGYLVVLKASVTSSTSPDRRKCDLGTEISIVWPAR